MLTLCESWFFLNYYYFVLLLSVKNPGLTRQKSAEDIIFHFLHQSDLMHIVTSCQRLVLVPYFYMYILCLQMKGYLWLFKELFISQTDVCVWKHIMPVNKEIPLGSILCLWCWLFSISLWKLFPFCCVTHPSYY